MKTRLLFLLLAGFLMLPLNTNGQIGYLRNRIVNKIIDDQLDSLEQSDKNEKPVNEEPEPATQNKSTDTQSKNTGNTGNQGGFNLGNLGIGKVNIKYKDEYNFDGSIFMQMEAYDKKEVTKMDYYTYFNSQTPNAAIEVKNLSDEEGSSGPGTSVFVFDGENKCFIMLTDIEGDKSGIISTIPSDSTVNSQGAAGQNVSKPTIVKTGKTRVIAGYKCDEYRVTDVEEKTYSNVWASKEVVIKADRRNWGKAGLPAYTAEFEGGIVLAMESYNNKNEIEMKMETIEIKSNIKHSVSPTGYTLMQMNF